jgi:hypothetical protein
MIPSMATFTARRLLPALCARAPLPVTASASAFTASSFPVHRLAAASTTRLFTTQKGDDDDPWYADDKPDASNGNISSDSSNQSTGGGGGGSHDHDYTRPTSVDQSNVKGVDRFGPNGHDYLPSPEAKGVMTTNLSVDEIHERLRERLQCKLAADFEEADAIRDELKREGVYIHDPRKEWRADGINFASGRKKKHSGGRH